MKQRRATGGGIAPLNAPKNRDPYLVIFVMRAEFLCKRCVASALRRAALL
jgi:hypothetical protein